MSSTPKKHTCCFNQPCWCGAKIDGQTGLGQSSKGWPRTSLSMGVHPDQIPEAMEAARQFGVPTEFSPSGEPILTSPGHQKRYAATLGYVDRGTRIFTDNITREDPSRG